MVRGQSPLKTEQSGQKFAFRKGKKGSAVRIGGGYSYSLYFDYGPFLHYRR